MKNRSRRSLLLTALVAALLGVAPLSASADDGGMLGSGTRSDDGTTVELLDGGMLGSGTRSDGGTTVEPLDEDGGYFGSGHRGGYLGSGN